jgi:hypothetical protein
MRALALKALGVFLGLGIRKICSWVKVGRRWTRNVFIWNEFGGGIFRHW